MTTLSRSNHILTIFVVSFVMLIFSGSCTLLSTHSHILKSSMSQKCCSECGLFLRIDLCLTTLGPPGNTKDFETPQVLQTELDQCTSVTISRPIKLQHAGRVGVAVGNLAAQGSVSNMTNAE